MVSPDDPRRWMHSVYVESRGGHAWAVATNSHFAAIEYLGITESQPGAVIIPLSDELLSVVQIATMTNERISLNNTPALRFCSLSVGRFWTLQGNAAIYPDEATAFETWREWLPSADDHKTTGRPMFVKADQLAILAQSAPSGVFVFPRHIDAEKAVIVRDVANANWLGVFYAQPKNGVFLNGAELPDWVN